ncbi:hypothetical protein SJAG_05617 [Schizosaccharomyces japonicus yFS275]|uniref:Uncharacterized protein n=1 Tax=Schizosaccharomyces japonicus (strain yFS275 / FY16936) TaxID=402676 RepID=T0T6D2_SCHJY|nr:hypothetical protein SJAG_05617 [Schizosaccharomyces japonicus yFS275]EQC52979.1 hypothetical protein SJAG_05617 [Schizosaccharomyces japonicus yFS275]
MTAELVCGSSVGFRTNADRKQWFPQMASFFANDDVNRSYGSSSSLPWLGVGAFLCHVDWNQLAIGRVFLARRVFEVPAGRSRVLKIVSR